MVLIDVGLWKDKAAKEAGKDSLRNFDFEIDSIPTALDVKAAILTKLKTLEKFSTATDD